MRVGGIRAQLPSLAVLNAPIDRAAAPQLPQLTQLNTQLLPTIPTTLPAHHALLPSTAPIGIGKCASMFAE